MFDFLLRSCIFSFGLDDVHEILTFILHALVDSDHLAWSSLHINIYICSYFHALPALQARSIYCIYNRAFGFDFMLGRHFA